MSLLKNKPSDPNGWETNDYIDVLIELHQDDYDVNNWEQDFIEDNVELSSFTERQKEVIRKLDHKYLNKG